MRSSPFEIAEDVAEVGRTAVLRDKCVEGRLELVGLGPTLEEILERASELRLGLRRQSDVRLARLSGGVGDEVTHRRG
ncbi:MAG: hypothetical protein ACYCX3_11550 [Thermoleophilia bacterium]